MSHIGVVDPDQSSISRLPCSSDDVDLGPVASDQTSSQVVPVAIAAREVYNTATCAEQSFLLTSRKEAPISLLCVLPKSIYIGREIQIDDGPQAGEQDECSAFGDQINERTTCSLETWSKSLPEVVDCILSWLTLSVAEEDYDSDLTIRRLLSYTSLTCRRWAKRLRPFLFHHLRLSTMSDVHFLIVALLSPVSHWLRPHVAAVYFQCSRDTTPDGIQLSPPIWRPLLTLLPSLSRLRINGEHSSGDTLFLCQYRLFLRSSKTLQYLELDGVRFPSLSSLLRLLENIPSLVVVEFWNVRWGNSGDTTTVLPISRAACQNIRILTTSYSDGFADLAWPFAAKSVGYQRRRQHSQESDAIPQDLFTIVQLIRVFYTDVRNAHSLVFSQTTEINDTSSFSIQSYEGPDVNSLSFTARSSQSSSIRQIERVAIAIGNSEDGACIEDMRSRDWASFGELVAGAHHLTSVDIICGRALDMDRLNALIDDISVWAPNLAGRLHVRHDPGVEDSRELAPELFGFGWQNWDREMDKIMD